VSSDPIAFAEARLEEDEDAAKAAFDPDFDDGEWRYDESAQPRPRIIGAAWESSLHSGIWDCEDPDDDCEQHRQPSRAQGEHIARHSPARALREVEAGRRLLGRHGPDAYGCQFCCHSPVGTPCADLRDLLCRWASHPDYDPDWKP
jgi:Family of unknown function (DUF6221)